MKKIYLTIIAIVIALIVYIYVGVKGENENSDTFNDEHEGHENHFVGDEENSNGNNGSHEGYDLVDHENMTEEEHNEFLESERDRNKEEGKMIGKIFDEKTVTVTKMNENKIFQIKNEKEEFNVVITEETLVLNNVGEKTELKEGDEITFYNNLNKPMTLQYPPNFVPEIVIVKTESIGFVDHLIMNHQSTDLDNTLKLNIKKPIKGLVIEKGEEVEKTFETLENKEVLVFYDITTRSIPAQTTPNKLIILN